MRSAANDTVNWLAAHGKAYGWRSVSATNWRKPLLISGQPVVVCCFNKNGDGHIAVVRPGSITKNGPTIAQMGLKQSLT